MTRPEAQEWCSSPVSQGITHGTRWAYFFTSVGKFIENNGLGRTIDVRKLEDNGRWDEKIAALGLRKFGFPEFPEVLGPLGVEVLR